MEVSDKGAVLAQKGLLAAAEQVVTLITIILAQQVATVTSGLSITRLAHKEV